MAKHGTMRTEINDGVATIFLDRPDKKNALSTELFEDLVETLTAWRRDDSVAVVVITGTEEYFSAGLDLDTMNWKSEADRLRWYDATYYGYLELLEYPKPTIAAVAGPTFGGGCDIAVFCDIRVSSANAKFGFPQIRFGLTPFVDPLQRIVGQSQAKLLVLTGRRIAAEEALRIGLIDQIAPAGELLAAAQALAAEIASTTTATVVRTTEMLRRSWAMDPMAAYVYGHVQYRDVHWNPGISERMLTARAKVGSGSR
jgi:enoyl-CoA hydratase